MAGYKNIIYLISHKFILNKFIFRIYNKNNYIDLLILINLFFLSYFVLDIFYYQYDVLFEQVSKNKIYGLYCIELLKKINI